MKCQILLYIVLICFASNAKSQIDLNDIRNYPWIPKKVDWRDGSFEALFFYNDTSFIKVAATFALTIRDSIRFMSEAGFILYSGNYKVIQETNEIVLKYRLLYRIVRITGEKLPGDFVDETMLLRTSGRKVELKAKTETSTQTKKFTNESLHNLKKVIEEFLPTVSKYWD